MTPTYTRKGERLYHYYVSMDLLRNREVPDDAGPARLPAAMVENAVIAEMRRLIGTPEVAARVLDQFLQEDIAHDQRAVLGALSRFNDLWEALFPAERARIVRLLVARVTVGPHGMAVDLRHHGLGTLTREMSRLSGKGSRCMTSDSIRVFVPLTVRHRNGRPKILPPETAMEQHLHAQDPHILKVLGRAWAWRRRLDSGEVSTVNEIATAEKVTDRFVSRVMRLAYLSPDVLERLLLQREPPAVSVNELINATYLPWAEQMGRVFEPNSVAST